MHIVTDTAKDPIEGLLHVVKVRPSIDVRDKLIDLEVDTYGNWVGFDAANYIWHKAIPDAA